MSKKIFIGPFEIAGYYSNLTKGFREIGLDVDFITYNEHPFDYGGETSNPVLIRLAKYFNHFKENSNLPFVISLIVSLPAIPLKAIWVIWAIVNYDVFIFGFGRSLLRKNLDLPILKWLGKTVIVNLAHGSDARPPYIDGALHDKNFEEEGEETIRSLTKASKEKIEWIEDNVSLIIGSPLSSSQFLDSLFINTFVIGAPYGISAQRDHNFVKEQNLKEENNTIRILHAPSDPAAKGSHLIIKAVENLKEKGYEINLNLIKGKKNSKVIKAIKQCDFVIDQVFCDTPMSGIASEAARFAKPTVVGGYGFEQLKNLVPKDMWPPSMTCHPDEIEDAIEEMILNIEKRKQIGMDAYEFIFCKREITSVAHNYMKLINNEIPNHWWFNPSDIEYLYGLGQSIDQTKEIIKQMINKFGAESLCLRHRPDLEQAFIDLTFGKSK